MGRIGYLPGRAPAVGAIPATAAPPLYTFDFTGGQLPQDVVFKRASGADFVGADGAFHSVGADVPVWDWVQTVVGADATMARAQPTMIPGLRISGAQTNLIGDNQSAATFAFLSHQLGDPAPDGNVTGTFSVTSEAGVPCVDCRVQGTPPAGVESYAYIYMDRVPQRTQALAATALAGATSITLDNAAGLKRYDQLVVGTGASAETVKLSAAPTGNVCPVYAIQQTHASGSAAVLMSGVDVADGDSVTAAAYVRMAAKNTSSDMSFDFRVEGIDNTDTQSLSEDTGGIVTAQLATTSNIVNNITKVRPFIRLHFYGGGRAYDLTIRIAATTALRNQFPVAGPILNSTGAAKTRAAASVTLPIPPGSYDMAIGTAEAPTTVIRGVAVGQGGYTIASLPTGCAHLASVRVYAAGTLLELLAPAPDFALEPGVGETLGDGGELLQVRGAGGMVATLSPVGDDEEDQGGAPVDVGAAAWHLVAQQGEYPFSAPGWDIGDATSIAFAFRTNSPLAQTLLGSGLGTSNSANNRLQIGFDGTNAISAYVDHVTVSSTGPLPIDFSDLVVVTLTKDGQVLRWHVNDLPAITTAWDRDVHLLFSGAHKVLFQQGLNVRMFDGECFGVRAWRVPLTAVGGWEATASWYRELKAKLSTVPKLTTVTRAQSGAQTPDGFTVAYDLSAEDDVTLEVLDPAGALAASIPSSPIATDRTLATSWWSNKVAVTGLEPGTVYSYRFRFADDRVSPAQTCRTANVAGVPDSFSWAFLSCSKIGSDLSPGMASLLIAQAGCRFVIHGGDLVYANVNTDDPKSPRAKLARAFAANSQAARLLATTALYWIIDDHCSGGPNDNDADTVLPTKVDGTVPTMATLLANARQTYTETVPHPPLAFPGHTNNFEWDDAHVTFIAADLFNQRRIASGTELNYGSVDQLQWLKDRLVAAGARGQRFVNLVISSWDNWQKNVPAEAQALADFISSTPGIPYVLVTTGDIHQSYGDDGTTALLPTICSSPVRQSLGLQIPHTPSWGGRAGPAIANDPAQFAIMFVTPTAIGARFYGSPHDSSGATLLGTVTTDKLPLPSVGFEAAALPVAAGVSQDVWIDRSAFHPTVAQVDWTSSTGESGTLTFSPMLRRQKITIDGAWSMAASTQSDIAIEGGGHLLTEGGGALLTETQVTITLSKPRGCTLGTSAVTLTVGSATTTEAGDRVTTEAGDHIMLNP